MNFQSLCRPLLVRNLHVSAVIHTNRTTPLIDSIIRVDHAGELGANCIYAGQMAVLGKTKSGPVIQHMWDQEKVHMETFEKLIVKYRVRPTALTPVWNVAGFLLGAGTALMGEKAAMACTVAVESVIVDHYNDQLRVLMAEPEKNKELMETIQKFRDEEQEHHDSGLDHGAEQAPFYSLLSEVIKFGCKQAIAISKGLLSPPKQLNYSYSRCYSTAAAAAATAAARADRAGAGVDKKEKWDLLSAVCLERKPVILKPLTDLEARVRDTMLEIESQNSYKSDHEMKHEEDVKLLKKDSKFVDVEAALRQTAHEFEEVSDKELENFKFEPARTAADEAGDVKSLNRELTNHLLLLVKRNFGSAPMWILPQGVRKGAETMRETAERVLAENFGDSLKVLFMGNAPCGFYKYKYPKELRENAVGAKIFFFKALYLGGQVDMAAGNANLDYQWATRNELRDLVKPDEYLRKVSLFLIDDDNDDNSDTGKSV